MSAPTGFHGRRWPLAGAAAVIGFAVLVLRFWHPVFGFTRFLQFEARNEATAVAEFREQPIYPYHNTGGYDGQYYAQIALAPGLAAPELRRAVDNLNYRARRILPGLVARAVALGRPGQIARVYAWLNLAVWLALAGLTWRVIGVRDGTGFAAWAGIMFSAGALTAVRYALTDLLAATLTLAAVGGRNAGSVPRRQAFDPVGQDGDAWRRPAGSNAGAAETFKAFGPPPRSTPFAAESGLLALAALSRETALLALPGIWTKPWFSRRNVFATVITTFPLALWLAYIQWRLGPGDAGLSNFTWPLVGFAVKWAASVRALTGPVDLSLTVTTLLAVAGLTVQAVYCLIRPCWDDPWWRVALAYLVLLVFLGQAVWEDFPGASFRAVLPLTVAANVLLARNRAGWAWLLGANLTVAAGVAALWQVPIDPRELAAASAGGRRALLWEGSGWYGAEHSSRHSWAWAGGPATVDVQSWQSGRATLHCTAELRSLAPQRLTVRQGTRICWQGPIGPVKRSAEWDVTVSDGQAQIELQGDHAPVAESAEAHSRALAFAVYDLKVGFPDVRSDPH